jgi:hypothetical protein
MGRRTIAKGTAKKQQIHRNRKPVNSLAECIRIWRKFEACFEEIYWSLSPSDANFAGISRDFAGFFSRAQKPFCEIHISEAI